MSMEIKTVRDLMVALRQGKYTSMGSYPIFFLTANGEPLSWDAVRAEIWTVARAVKDRGDQSWRVVTYDVNWEDPDMYCAHTHQRIEAAYADQIHDNPLTEGLLAALEGRRA